MTPSEHDSQSSRPAGGATEAAPWPPQINGYDQQSPTAYGYPSNQPYGAQPSPAYGGPGGAPTLDQPWYGIGFVDAVKRGFAKYARFDGRASRGEYWWWTLATSLAFIVLFVLVGIVAGVTSRGTGEPSPFVAILGLVVILALLALMVPTIAVSVRRLHDADFSGWLYLLTFTYVGSFVLLVFFALPAKPGGVRFDRRPVPGGYPG